MSRISYKHYVYGIEWHEGGSLMPPVFITGLAKSFILGSNIFSSISFGNLFTPPVRCTHKIMGGA